MEVDEAIRHLKFYGPWQFIVFISINLAARVTGAWHMTAMFYLAYQPPHHCKIPNNSSVEDLIPSDENGKLSSCFMFVNSSTNNQTTPCTDGWTYDTSESGPTIATKWNLVCDRAYLSDFSQMLFSLGLAIGCLVLTKPADVFGRKWVFLVYTALMSLFSLLTTAVDKIEFFYLFKFVSGLFTGASTATGFIYLMECFSKENKSIYMVNEDVLWSIGLSIILLLTFLISNWIYTEIVIDLISLISIIFFAFWLHETVPWLHANNRIDEAEKSLLWAARVNNVTFERPILKPLEEIQDNPHENNEIKDDTRLISDDGYRSYGQNLSKFGFMKNVQNMVLASKSQKKKLKSEYSISELFKNKYLLKHMSLGLILMVDNFAYFGIFNVSGFLSINRYFSGFLHLILDIPACFLSYSVSKKLGRKKLIIILHFLSTLPMFVCAITVSSKDQTNTVLYITFILNITFKFIVSGAYAITHINGAELFPTNIRNQANGICHFFGRFGLMSASFTPSAIQTSPREFYIVMALITLLGGFLCFLLPETLHRSLPETIEDIEEWYKDGDGGAFKPSKVQENIDDKESSDNNGINNGRFEIENVVTHEEN